jgi:hypothetical protein
MRFSRTLAWIFGVLLPVAETVRRWGTWQEFPPALFDDYIAGALLLGGAWWTGRDPERGRVLLAAAWGFLCGLAYGSFFGQVWRLQHGDTSDPAPIPSFWVAVIKGAGFLLAILALILTLTHRVRGKQFEDAVPK